MRNASPLKASGMVLSGLLSIGLSGPLMAQNVLDVDQPVAECTDSNCQTAYEAEFFTPYAPVTALDMVNNLPGFNLDDGDSGSRGFGGAAGNILINGERVSAKSERPSDLLSRIPAADVERIIVIRGQVGGTDLRGQSVIADVLRRNGGATGAWSATTAMAHPDTRLLPSGSVSYSDRSGALGYTLGADASRSRFILDAEERVLDGDGRQAEVRDEVYAETDERVGLSANATYAGARTRYGLNAQYEYEDELSGEDSLRQPARQDAFLLVQDNDSKARALELGFDAERRLGEHVNAKLIGLYRRDDQSSQRRLILGEPDQPGETTTETLTDQLESERILRLELDYSGLRGQLIEASVEGAINRLDSDFELLRLSQGGLEPVDVPGARTDVEEERLDFALANSFSLGAVSVDLELAGEASEIKQTGGFAETRSFFFWKPSLTLSHAPNDLNLWRGRLLRQVNQLDFSDFVSAADLGDDELQLGNPNLSPETTITLDLSYEKRFDDIGLISLTAFYDRIDDVEDILPLEGELEVPGNIGSGFRWGLRGELTLPLERVGITGGRLDFTGRWQTSGVDDPLSGRQRELSNERPWTARIDFRQDLPASKIGWGMDAGFFGPYENPGLDELDRFSRVWDFGGFVETRAIENLRIRLGVSDLFRETTDRDRLVFDGPRDSAPVDFRELRDRTRSRRIFLQVRGVF
jgi:outer membrane receptor protein involved in Fe transport